MLIWWNAITVIINVDDDPILGLNKSSPLVMFMFFMLYHGFLLQVKDPEETIHIITGLKTYTQYLVSGRLIVYIAYVVYIISVYSMVYSIVCSI